MHGECRILKGEGRKPGILHEGVGGYEEVLLNDLHRPYKWFGRDKVTQPPAGHGIELGKSVDHKGLVRILQDAVCLSSIHQPVIYLIRYNPGTQPGNLSHDLRAQKIPCGIGRGIDDDPLGSLVDLSLYGFRPVLKSILLKDLDFNRFATHEMNEAGIAGIVGI